MGRPWTDDDVLRVARSFGDRGVDVDDLVAAMQREGFAIEYREAERVLDNAGWADREVSR